ncbi:MAG: hypothetical protein HAW67_03870 [Endozoicomonadaceae bacterium]|nr:hypothetical protein [Endozoicomonadaceae bacterium]
MQVEIKTTVAVSAKRLVEEMTMTELAEFCSELSEKLKDDFHLRAEAAENFADGLSEDGCRFLAEVVTSHYSRNKRID